MDITSYLLGKKASGGGGGSDIKNGYTGHYDAEGLAQIGWTEEDIKHYQDNGVTWNKEQDNYFKLRSDELEGTTSTYNRFLSKNISSSINVSGRYALIGIPVLNVLNNMLSYASTFSNCYSLITVPLINTGNATAMNSMFSNCSSLISVPLFNTEKVTTMSSMFTYCTSLRTVPLFDTKAVTNMSSMFYNCSSLRSVPQFNTSNVTNMNKIFQLCCQLIDVPILNTSKVTNMQNMFGNCFNLSDQSLNNILEMCINATAYNGTKTLAYLGIASDIYQASRIQALSNYQDFINAGWTIGY